MLITMIGFGVHAYANFTVTNVTTSHQAIHGVYHITVTVQPTFTPPSGQPSTWTIVVVPTNANPVRAFLESQRQSVTMIWNGHRWEGGNRATVVFGCRTTTRPQCTIGDFTVSQSFRN